MQTMVCPHRKPTPPYTNIGTAGYDGRWWVHAECGLPTEAWLRSLGDEMLNYFRGGELNGNAYTTTVLLDNKQLMQGYRWTPHVITSQKTGSSARVWLHESIEDEAPSPSPTQNIGQDQVDLPQTGDTLVTSTQEVHSMTDSLIDRRKAGKFSRKQVAEAAGISEAKVYRIEQPGDASKRTTDEERATVAGALESLEKAAAEKAAAEPAPAEQPETPADPA